MSSLLTTANVDDYLDGLAAELAGPHLCDRCGMTARVIWWAEPNGHLALCGHHARVLPADADVTRLGDDGRALAELPAAPTPPTTPPVPHQNHGLAGGALPALPGGHSGAYGRPCMCPSCRRAK